MDERTIQYAQTFSRMIRCETVSSYENTDQDKFIRFRALLKELFPTVFSVCELHEFRDGIVLHWKGTGSEQKPVMFMNHHDVVEAHGEWQHGPFSADLSDGKIWGRGTLDDKGGLWAMLQAGEELALEGFAPQRDFWFVSTSTEELSGEGAREIAGWFRDQHIRFEMSFDEGGMILQDPIKGAHGTFAMIGMGEKGCADLKFTAVSDGGHASTPPKDTPLVRLGRFMAAVDRNNPFPSRLNDTTDEMFRRIAPYMGKTGRILENAQKVPALLEQAGPMISPFVGAFFRTTLAFTMAKGSDGRNVIPREAWVIGNMRYSHHEGRDKAIERIRRIAKRYGVETEVLDPGDPSGITDYRGEAFRKTEEALKAVFPDVIPVPYILTGASDSRLFDKVSDQCIRFLPFLISDEQLSSIHGINENLDVDTLVPAVDFYKHLMRSVS